MLVIIYNCIEIFTSTCTNKAKHWTSKSPTQRVCSRCWAWLYVYQGGYIYCLLKIRPSGSTVQRSKNNWISTPRLVTAWTITLRRESHFQFPRNRWQRCLGKDDNLKKAHWNFHGRNNLPKTVREWKIYELWLFLTWSK